MAVITRIEPATTGSSQPGRAIRVISERYSGNSIAMSASNHNRCALPE